MIYCPPTPQCKQPNRFGLITLFSLLSALAGWAQPTATPDSLLRYLQTAKQDTTYVRVANEYTWWLINPLDDLDRADSVLKRTEALAKRLNYPMGLQRVYFNQGRVYLRQEKFALQALERMQKAHQIVMQAHLPASEVQRSLSGIGQAYLSLDQLEKSLQFFLAAIKVTEQYRLRDYATRAYIGVGEVMGLLGRKREMEEYYKKAYALAYQDEDKTMILWAEQRMVYVDMGGRDKQEALLHLQKALTNAGQYANRTWRVTLLITTATCYEDLGQWANAFHFYKRAEQEAVGASSKTLVNLALGSYYYSRRNYRLAEAHLRQAMQVAKQMKWGLEAHTAAKILAQLFAQTGEYQKAYRYHVQYSQISDSLFSSQTAVKIRDLKTRYELGKRDTQIKLLNQQEQNALFQRNAYLIGAGFLLIFGVLLSAWLLNRARLRRFEEAQRLRQQIAHDLHDEMGSTLSSISLLSSMSNDLLHQPSLAAETPELVQRMVAKIFTDSRQMQGTIDELIWMVKPGNDSLAQIAARIRAYAEPLLASKGITFGFAFDPVMERQPVSLEIRRNLYLLGKEAINNLVKHAQATQATLRFDYGHDTRSGGPVTVLIVDNGRGFDPAAPTDRMGLQSMNQRAKAMGGSLTIHSAPGQGTRLKLTVVV